jgi:dimeric dUTPase (all-alpha-NTP-PPase superfamily)
MFTKKKVIKMFQLQEKFNVAVNPEWRDDENRCDMTAIAVEGAELISHVGFKWWKHEESNIEQAQMELVDIWHFLMSDILRCLNQKFAEDPNSAIDELHGFYDFINDIELSTDIDKESIIATAHGLIGGASFSVIGLEARVDDEKTLGGREVVLSAFRQLMATLQMSGDKLYSLYIGKNALNHFRQSNGYKDGTYVKVWNGLEDNEHLMNIINGLLAKDVSDLYEQCLADLKVEYDTNAK